MKNVIMSVKKINHRICNKSTSIKYYKIEYLKQMIKFSKESLSHIKKGLSIFKIIDKFTKIVL